MKRSNRNVLSSAIAVSLVFVVYGKWPCMSFTTCLVLNTIPTNVEKKKKKKKL